MDEDKKKVMEPNDELDAVIEVVDDLDGLLKKKEPGKATTESTADDNKSDDTSKETSSKSSEQTKEEKKEGTSSETQKDDKDQKEKSDDKASKNSEDVATNAISQSKRLSDAKAAKEAKPVEEKSSKKKKKSSSDGSHKGVKIFFASVFSILLIAYVAGFVYFNMHFYPEVYINGIEVSNMDKANAKSTLDRFYKDYSLSLETIEIDKIEVIKGSDFDMNIVLRDEIGKCISLQKPYLWFVNMFEVHNFEVGADASWNQATLKELLDSLDLLDTKNMEEPADAYIGIVDGKYQIVKEKLGTTIDRDAFDAAVNDALTSVQSGINLKGYGCYVLPQVYDDNEDLQTEYNAKADYGNLDIKLQLDDLTLEPGMEMIDAVLEKSGDSYKVSKAKVTAYVADLANQYDSLGKEREFTTSFGSKKVKVLGNAFGYEMNQEETADALYNALNSKRSTTVEAVFNSKGYTLQGENDIGDTYIEVNLSEQRVIAYKNGKKVAEDDCVSGNESAGHGTCIGLYAIQDKLSPTVLRGEKVPKTKTVTKKKGKKKVKVTETTYEYDYESPVTFWMQFNGGIGLHDAAGWRSVYGGSIYYYSGSHGCVNLPYKFAQTLYENFQVGDPVVVYFWDNENRK